MTIAEKYRIINSQSKLRIIFKVEFMKIRLAVLSDVKAANEIYDAARLYMKRSGNSEQWSGSYPGEADILEGIAEGTSYVCEDGGEIVATFYFKVGEDPTYKVIYDGAWKNEDKYAAIHRIAVKYHGRGIADFCYNECFKMHPNIKIDTHRDNIPMQRSLLKCGFEYCGIIYLQNGEERLAYQRYK